MTNNQESGKKLITSYIIGFVLSVILVLAAYHIATTQMFTGETLYFVLAGLGLLVVLVQAIFFIRLNAKSQDDKWNLITFIFTIIVIMIVVIGSLWIMYNLNYYMVN
ncbi:MAG: cyoD [Gammaproteobacteria bacterium]|jgi:cytochrome o ubiquinol oxidase operon protein cyoD|nr:cyoD [Gammaproteobacteria bacterium]